MAVPVHPARAKTAHVLLRSATAFSIVVQVRWFGVRVMDWSGSPVSDGLMATPSYHIPRVLILRPTKYRRYPQTRSEWPYRMLTARAASSATVMKEMSACTIIKTFAQRESTGESVGEKAVLVLNATNR